MARRYGRSIRLSPGGRAGWRWGSDDSIEIAYLSDVAADGMRPADNVQGLAEEGWTI
ncbi:hypothetical protein [Mycolicibacterium hodleri]|uniref:hypothetical protein n=1 Tax=Mycolicibacterium hodleri TaxID=49897 RepID=UPI001376231F|nr:hypothetical protein [Mycolicibacterium hodleri]